MFAEQRLQLQLPHAEQALPHPLGVVRSHDQGRIVVQLGLDGRLLTLSTAAEPLGDPAPRDRPGVGAMAPTTIAPYAHCPS
ncbi:hypothetical protein [Streptomyces sp. NPDC001816]|uniref:hypothetical protein n=1 Tax=Streptomyces sp. NPDC001816 TaxID=3364612 RepID=UPI00369AA509